MSSKDNQKKVKEKSYNKVRNFAYICFFIQQQSMHQVLLKKAKSENFFSSTSKEGEFTFQAHSYHIQI